MDVVHLNFSFPLNNFFLGGGPLIFVDSDSEGDDVS